MQSFEQHIAEMAHDKQQAKFQKWIGHHIDNTNIAHDVLRKKFVKKHGEQHLKHFDSIVQKMVE